MNRESSRSHSVFTCVIQSKTIDQAGIITTLTSRLNLVDLAGDAPAYVLLILATFAAMLLCKGPRDGPHVAICFVPLYIVGRSGKRTDRRSDPACCST